MSDDTETRRVLAMLDELESLTRESLDLLQTLRGWLMHTRDLMGPHEGPPGTDTLAHDVASIDAHIAELREALGVG